MNVALTGITGMIGSHLIKKLAQPGASGIKYNVRSLIRETSIVEHLKAYEEVDYVIGHLNDRDALAKLVDGMETVIHLAHFPGPVKTADELVNVNVNGSYELLEAAKKARVKRFIFMSSCAIFGEILPSVTPERPLDENHPVRPGTLYGSIKSAIEAFCFYYHRNRAFDVTIFRPVTVYGLRPDIDKSEWFQTIDYLATNYNVDMKGSTKYVSVDAVVQAVLLALTKPESTGKIYNLIDGHIHNIDLGQLIVEVIDSFGEVQGVKGQEGVPMDNTAARNLGVEFKGKDGIREYIKLVHKLQLEYGGERAVEQW